jgi:hypothetical protein
MSFSKQWKLSASYSYAKKSCKLVIMHWSHIMMQTFVLDHKWDLIIHICVLVSFCITRSTSQKSPHMIITFPQNGALLFKISFNGQSKAFKQYLFVNRDSSLTIAVANLMRIARSFCFSLAIWSCYYIIRYHKFGVCS